MKVVVVESPAKAKTINKYLGRDYKVVASYGHVRDLPAKDGSVLPDDDFAMSREIDRELVDAYLARRALDYLVGFTLSPVLWRKLPGSRSAGRVQSVALRLVCDRELEIEKFIPQEYWSLTATLLTPRAEAFEARLVGADGKKIQRLDIGSGAEAEAFKQALENASFVVANVEARPT